METNTNPTKPRFARKLSRYSALTVGGAAGTMAVFESSEAANVLTNVNISLVDAPATVNTQIDLNNDAIDDVEVTVVSSQVLVAGGLNGAQLAGTIGGFGGPIGIFYPTAFVASQLVNDKPGQIFSAGSTSAPNTFGTLANGTAGTIYGNWAGATATDGYVGVKFDVGGNTHFGWVHVDWDPTTSTATIDSYAYNNTAGAASHVPEPSSLVLLGLGAVGLAARRRRKECS